MKHAGVYQFDERFGWSEIGGNRRRLIFFGAVAAVLFLGIIGFTIAARRFGPVSAHSHNSDGRRTPPPAELSAGAAPSVGSSSTSSAPASDTAGISALARPRVPITPEWRHPVLVSHPEVAAKVEKMLPPGTDLDYAAAGFENPSDLLTTIHAANNLSMRLENLKTAIGNPPATQPLAKAIAQLNPHVAAASEVKRAQKQAKDDLSALGIQPAKERKTRKTAVTAMARQ